MGAMAKSCDKCGKPKLYQSYPVNPWESLARWVLLRPYICGFCNIRVMRFAARAEHRSQRRAPHLRKPASSLGFDPSVVKAISIDEVRSAIRENEERRRHVFGQS